MAITNIVLAVFNLMPFPPFDGSRIWLVFLPQAWYFGVMKYERYIMGAVFALVYFGVLDTPLEFLYSGCLSLLDSATAFVDAIALWIFGS